MAGSGGMAGGQVTVARLVPWLIGLVLLWLLLTGGEPLSWVIGLPAIVAASWSAVLLEPPNVKTFSLVGLLRFAPWFLKASLLASIDVARRAMAVSPRLNPGLIVYRSRLPEGAPLVFFCSCICLLPGTLTADLRGAELSVHVIDEALPNEQELQRLEGRVARVFGAKDGDHA